MLRVSTFSNCTYSWTLMSLSTLWVNFFFFSILSCLLHFTQIKWTESKRFRPCYRWTNETNHKKKKKKNTLSLSLSSISSFTTLQQWWQFKINLLQWSCLVFWLFKHIRVPFIQLVSLTQYMRLDLFFWYIRACESFVGPDSPLFFSQWVDIKVHFYD